MKIIHAIQKEMRLLNENPFDLDKRHTLYVHTQNLENWLLDKPLLNDEFVENDINNELLAAIDHLLNSFSRQKGIQNIDNEIKDITRGWYQEQMIALLYLWRDRSEPFGVKSDVKQLDSDETFLIYPIIEEAGLSCAVALPSEPIYYHLEIFLTFNGTHDFASTAADLDKGGPGQELLKKLKLD